VRADELRPSGPRVGNQTTHPSRNAHPTTEWAHRARTSGRRRPAGQAPARSTATPGRSSFGARSGCVPTRPV